MIPTGNCGVPPQLPRGTLPAAEGHLEPPRIWSRLQRPISAFDLLGALSVNTIRTGASPSNLANNCRNSSLD
uniref:Uncharacterized protein n=1 Tax=Arundo donax TaxID=35708 RepID=A0A0A9HIF5_ARUDO